jgi:hypothetical protein
MALLTDDLIAFWEFEEASGIRYDSHLSHNLTDNNTVGQATGKVGNAADLERDNSEYLSITPDAGLKVGDVDFTASGWVYMETTGTTNGFIAISQWASASPTDATDAWYFVFRDHPSDGDDFKFVISTDAGSLVGVDDGGGHAKDTWFFVALWFDASANTMNFQVNNGTAVSQATGSSSPSTNATSFVVGADAAPQGYWDGRLDQWGFWKRTLTSSEKTFLYNSGNGRTYADINPYKRRSPSKGAVVGSAQMY